MRTDAQRNRERLLEVASTLFRERGLEVGVSEIAEAAGVGRGTLFRNFATKDDLIAAIVLDRMQGAIAAGAALLAEDPDDAEVTFTFIADMVGRQQADRALLEGVNGQVLAGAELQETHDKILEILDALLARGQRAGAIRPEVTSADVMLLLKGICLTAAVMPNDKGGATMLRHLELVRAAISTPEYARPLRGSADKQEWSGPKRPDHLLAQAELFDE